MMAAAAGIKIMRAGQVAGQKSVAREAAKPPVSVSSEECSGVECGFVQDRLSVTGSITNQLQRRCWLGVIHLPMQSAWPVF